jgi:hypothetical protein
MNIYDYIEFCHDEKYEVDEAPVLPEPMPSQEFLDSIAVGDIWDIDELLDMAEAIYRGSAEIDDPVTNQYITKYDNYSEVEITAIWVDNNNVYVEVKRH